MNSRSEHGYTCLHRAITKNKADHVAVLLKCDRIEVKLRTTADHESQTPLWLACSADGHEACVSLLLEHPDIKRSDCLEVLPVAIQNLEVSVTEMLLGFKGPVKDKRPADEKSIAEDICVTSGHYLLELMTKDVVWEDVRVRVQHEQMVLLLLKFYNGSINQRFGHRQETFLHLAVNQELPLVINELLSNPAIDIEMKNNNGCSAHASVRQNYLHILRMYVKEEKTHDHGRKCIIM